MTTKLSNKLGFLANPVSQKPLSMVLIQLVPILVAQVNSQAAKVVPG